MEKKQIIEEIAQLDEPLTNENIPPFLLNAIIDDNTGEVDIKALIHGIEVLENKVNIPKNRKTAGIPAPHTRTGKKSIMEPSNGHISGQCNH